MIVKRAPHIRNGFRRLFLEQLDERLPFADLDDSLSEAISLGTASTNPITRARTIDVDTDVDMYRISVTSGQTVDFDIDTALNGQGGLGSFIRLFNSSGQQLASNNNGMAPGESVLGFDSYLRYTFNTGGNYYLSVTNATNTTSNPVTGNGDIAGGPHATGDYQLTAVALPVDNDDSLSEATFLGAIAASPDDISDEIVTDVDVDLYRFTVTNGQVVDFDIDTALNGPGGVGSFIRLFNAQGQEIAFNDNGTAPGESALGFDSYLRYTFATGGTYYLGVSSANNTLYNTTTGGNDSAGGQNSIGAYRLLVQSAPTAPVDSDDSLTEAIGMGPITITPAVENGSISPDVDVDLYEFTATAGQIVDIDLDTSLNGPGGLGAFLRLFNAQSQEIAFNDNAIAPGENTVGFDPFLRFTIPTSGTYYIGVSNANNTLYNTSTGGGDVSGGANATGTYQLIVQALPLDDDDTLSEATLLGPVSGAPNTVTNSISPDTDVDLYLFTVTAGQTVDFDIDTALNGPGGLGSFLRLFNAQGQEIAFNNDGSAPGEGTVSFDAYLRYTFTTGGTYYVGVSNATNTLYNTTTGGQDAAGGPHSIGTYQLRLESTALNPNDTDDTLAEASSIDPLSTTPDTTPGTIASDIDVDIYRFSATAGQTVDFNINTPLNGSGGLDSYIRIFNAQGQQIASNDDGAAPGEGVLGLDSYLRVTFTASGSYYVSISNANNRLYDPLTGGGDTPGGSNSSGDYSLVVQSLPLDTDDSLVEATVVGPLTSAPVSFSDSIVTDTDVDLYRFTVTNGQIVDFDIDTPLNGPGGVGSFIRLFDSSGQEIAFNNNATAPGEGTLGFDSYLRYNFTIGGTYYLGVSNANNTLYNTTDGSGDTAGGANSIGAYSVTMQVTGSSALDPDDALSEASLLGPLSTAPTLVSGNISPDTDVNLYRFTVSANQTIDFDIDTPLNGPGGLGSYLRLFNSTGQQISFNDNGASAGETLGFDSYLRFTFTSAGTYYLGVSNATNVAYEATTGDGDVAGGANSTGNYQLTAQIVPVGTPTLALSATVTAISELNGTTTATLARSNTDLSVPLVVSLASNDTSEATVPTTVTIPANQSSITFTINAVDDFIVDGSQFATITASATGFSGGTVGIQVNDNDTASSPTLALSASVSSISELNGTTTATLTRSNSDVSVPLVVNLTSSDTSEATVPTTVTIPANQTSVTFTITAVDDTLMDGSQPATITGAAAGFNGGTVTIQVNDNDSVWTNPNFATDVNDDGNTTAFDALAIINYLNQFGAGPVPEGSPPPYYDVNGDNLISAFDALVIINYLNANPIGSGGEAATEAGIQSAGEATDSAEPVVDSRDAYFAELGVELSGRRREPAAISLATTSAGVRFD
ncbi:beta strand repeat-containing protein [Anatilimnocola sp. NA78]|uniref:beta strand repeat-containing protein n=1 Tax=Anatilimnocola sp. NA78 TaxID=3415683 RepID=UPI003CE49504